MWFQPFVWPMMAVTVTLAMAKKVAQFRRSTGILSTDDLSG
jgi:hypothetical protein